MKFFKSKHFPFKHERNFNAKVIIDNLFLMKLSAVISDSKLLFVKSQDIPKTFWR